MFLEISALMERMKEKEILVLGDIMADAYIQGKVDRISPEAPVPVLHTQSKEVRLGGAANVALNLKALGIKVRLASSIGQDEMGQTVIGLLKKEGIESPFIAQLPDRPTTVKTRIMAGSQHLLRLDEENSLPTSEQEKEIILSNLKGVLNSVDAIVFEDYDKGYIFPEMIQLIVSEANKKNIPVLVDPKKRHFSLYQNVTVFKPNLKEMKEGLHIEVKPDDHSSIKLACQAAAAQLGCQGILLTLSEFGMAYWSPHFFYQTPARKRNIADVSGAGDTVIAVAAACLAAGAEPETILQLSNLAGGLVCEYSGVVPINKETLAREAELLFKS